jgi:hypothetical protein
LKEQTQPDSKAFKLIGTFAFVQRDYFEVNRHTPAAHEVLECKIYRIKDRNFSDLVQNKEIPIFEDPEPSITTISFNRRKDPRCGALKEAYFGRSNTPIFPQSSSCDVCVKQAFYRESGKRNLYDNPSQFQILVSEINTSRWASALMAEVYMFMATENQKRGEPPFDIPKLRYVNVVLAVANNVANDVYLLEEVVGPLDGEFKKYINNTSAVPCPESDPKRKLIAEFLSFTQHVQMLATKGMAFVSDQQGENYLTLPQLITNITTGGYSLLSDPQIITSP